MASWENTSDSITIKEVDTSIYTAWRHGKIVFKHQKFKYILTQLERHYNVQIESSSKVFDDKRFTATFDDETIEQVLESFSKNINLSYTIKNNTITINPINL